MALLDGFLIKMFGRPNIQINSWPVAILVDDGTGKPVPLTLSGGALPVTSGGAVTPVDSQVSVTTASTSLAAAAPAGQSVAVFNNGLTSFWIALDGTDPVADTGSEGAPNGDGKGIRVYPGGFYETPSRITTAVKAITATGTALATVVLS